MKRWTIVLLVMMMACWRVGWGEEESLNFKLISYNILGGGGPRVDGIAGWLAEMRPDFVALQELNGWGEERLRKEALRWGHAYTSLMVTKLEGDHYNFGVTSSQPFEVLEKRQEGFWHGIFHVRIPFNHSATSHGLHLLLTHLNPHSAQDRRTEMKEIREIVDDLPYFVVMGDFNTLSPIDARYYDLKGVPTLLRSHAHLSSKYMTPAGLIDYEPIEILSEVAFDLDYYSTSDDPEWFARSVPSPLNEDAMHATNLRIDYVFASPFIFDHDVKDCGVLHSSLLDQLSDHYPVVCEFELDPLLLH